MVQSFRRKEKENSLVPVKPFTQTPGFRPGGILLEIRGGGVPPGSPNPDVILDKSMPFSVPVFRPNIYIYKDLNYVAIA